MRDRLLRPLLLLATLIAVSLPALAGTPEAPEVVDAPGDSTLPQLDLAAVWFEATPSDLLVHIQRGSEASGVPGPIQCQQGQCVGASVSLRVVFQVVGPDGAFLPRIGSYNASYVLVRVGMPDADRAAIVGYQDGQDNFVLVSPANVTADGANITVQVPRSSPALALDGTGPHSIVAPYALSYVLTCAPDAGQGSPVEGCLSRPAPVAQLAAGWDRAPDAGVGSDYAFDAPAGADDAATDANATDVASATTVTVVQTRTETQVVTETQSFVETVTGTFAPDSSDVKAAPGAGVLVLVGIVALAAVRRRLR